MVGVGGGSTFPGCLSAGTIHICATLFLFEYPRLRLRQHGGQKEERTRPVTRGVGIAQPQSQS